MGVGTHLRRCVLKDGADEAAAHPGHQAEESGRVAAAAQIAVSKYKPR